MIYTLYEQSTDNQIAYRKQKSYKRNAIEPETIGLKSIMSNEQNRST